MVMSRDVCVHEEVQSATRAPECRHAEGRWEMGERC